MKINITKLQKLEKLGSTFPLTTDMVREMLLVIIDGATTSASYKTCYNSLKPLGIIEEEPVKAKTVTKKVARRR